MIYLPLLLFSLAFIICSEFSLSFAMEIKLPSFLSISAPTILRLKKPSERAFWPLLVYPFAFVSLNRRALRCSLTLNIQLFSRVFYISFAGWEASPREEISLVFNFGWGYAVMPHKCTPAYRSPRQRDP